MFNNETSKDKATSVEEVWIYILQQQQIKRLNLAITIIFIVLKDLICFMAIVLQLFCKDRDQFQRVSITFKATNVKLNINNQCLVNIYPNT